jgi:hypothetical protein
VPQEIPNAADLFKIIPHYTVDAAAQAGPGAGPVDPPDLGGRRLRAKWRQYAKVAVPGNPGRGDQARCRGVLQVSGNQTTTVNQDLIGGCCWI